MVLLKRLYFKLFPQTNVRKRFIQSIPLNQKLLEIGPFFRPLAPGSNVKYFDIKNQAGLIETAKDYATKDEIQQIPEIDYVSPTGDLSVINEKFGIIFSSHVIEHQLDLIKHLQGISNLLDSDGTYFLIIPDKRFCFDHFNVASQLVDVIAAHHEPQVRHRLRNILLSSAL
jgi:2-polyprenyl-3-methyl-5-hydroxy-6-metoxy-1,4-benzoquinol methylase